MLQKTEITQMQKDRIAKIIVLLENTSPKHIHTQENTVRNEALPKVKYIQALNLSYY